MIVFDMGNFLIEVGDNMRFWGIWYKGTRRDVDRFVLANRISFRYPLNKSP